VTSPASTLTSRASRRGVPGTYVEASENGCQSEGSGSPPPVVQVPTASRIVSTITNGPATDCPAGQGAGWNRVVLKIVTDQQKPSQDIVAAGQILTETVTLGTPNNLGIGTVGTSMGMTDALGHFQDRLRVCSTACPGSTGKTVATQVIKDVYNGAPFTLSPNTFTYTWGVSPH